MCRKTIGAHGGVPLDRYPGELSISREWWCREIAGGEGFAESSMEPILHMGRFREVLLEGVDDGPVFLADIKRDEVSRPVVPRATSRGNGRMCGIPGWVEVSRTGPPSGCFP